MSKLLTGLNKPQQEAVTTTKGPVLVLAGAGSGKTRALTHRIAYLIAEEKIKPWNILAVTFTNKASKEMQSRVKELMSGKVEHWPAMGTFHSICVRLLRREIEPLGMKNSFVIYDSNDSLNLIKKVMKELNQDPKKINPKAVQVHISNAKNELLDSDSYAGSDFFTQQVEKIYKDYQKNLERNQAMDFDDLIMKTVVLFKQEEKILQKYQKLWQYILIDEYQDTNEAQYQLIRLLGGEKPNLCVVGDDYQAIYGFRGANYQNILNFEDDYPNTKVVMLEQNYRSTQTILDAAQTIIGQNKGQKDKKLWTDNDAGEKITIEEVRDEAGEGQFIVDSILGLKEKEPEKDPDELVYEYEDEESIIDKIMKSSTFNKRKRENKVTDAIREKIKRVDLSKYVVLYRTNAQSRAIEEAFLKYGVPYKLIGGIRFYERREIKDMISYLKMLVNPDDWVGLERIVNAPPKGIGPVTWQKIEQAGIQNKKNFLEIEEADLGDMKPKGKLAFLTFQTTMKNLAEDIKEKKAEEIVDIVAEESGYKNFIQDGTEEGERRWENIQELKTACLKFSNYKGAQALELFLEEIALIHDQDEVKEDLPAVQMMTIHAAKGLEFSNVFLIGMEEGLFPHSRCLFDPKEMEEERRLCYVAMTRAKKKLYISFASERTIYGQTQVNAPSRFIDELPQNLVE